MDFFRRIERWAARMQGKGMGAETCDFEVRVIAKLLRNAGRPAPKVVFDVGANLGNWTAAAEQAFPDARFFLFEPSRQNAGILRERFPGHTLVPCALSDRAGEFTLYSDKEGSGLASLQKREIGYLGIDHHATYQVQTTRLDSFLQEQGLAGVDLLKIDVEGHELAVLQGAGEILANIGLIQFEFGGTQIDSRTFFRDFWMLLHSRFAFYRICPFGVYPINHYSESEEYFRISNYLALNRG
jgi:FkbM family methyltransferase